MKVINPIIVSIPFLLGGITLIFNSSIEARATGIGLIAIGIIIPLCYLNYRGFREISSQISTSDEDLSKEIASEGEKLSKKVAGYSQKLEQLTNDLGFRNNGRFIDGGFLGLQRQMYEVESDQNTGNEYVRMALFRYLPSHMRLSRLPEGKGRKLWRNWEPVHLAPDYVKLVNQRMKAFEDYIDDGGVVREIYLKSELDRYVERGFAFFDGVEDPLEEIEERIKALLKYLGETNYFLCLLDKYPHSPNFLLKSKVGLVIDLRSSETDRKFIGSVDGIYTEDSVVIKEFERKFKLIWDSSSKKEENREYLEELLKKLREKNH